MTEAPRKLGPIVRIIEVYFGAVLFTVLGYALLMPACEFSYDITLLRIMVAMAAAARSLWLIERRASTTRVFVIGSMSVVVALSVADMWLGGEYARIAEAVGLPFLITGGVLYYGASLFIIAYFAASPRVREIFAVPLKGSTEAGKIPSENGAKGKALDVGAGSSQDEGTAQDEEDIYPKAFTWPWWRNLGLYYASFSIFGHWAEIGFCWLIVLGIFMGDYDFSHAQLWDWWLCPYPAEGLAMVLIVLVLKPFKDWLYEKLGKRFWPTLIISFAVNMLVCAGVDFFTGITANANYELWDYRELPFNFMGQVLLQNTIVYSVAATLIVWVIYPLLAKLLARAPQNVVNGLFVGFAGFYAFLEVLYYVHIGPTGLVFG